MTEIQKRIFEDIIKERKRQEQLKKEGRFKYTLADPEMSDYERLVAIGEEYGELCQATLEEKGSCAALSGHEKIAELVQVVACGVAWLECIYSQEEKIDWLIG